jgi:hypothetical protein
MKAQKKIANILDHIANLLIPKIQLKAAPVTVKNRRQK